MYSIPLLLWAVAVDAWLSLVDSAYLGLVVGSAVAWAAVPDPVAVGAVVRARSDALDEDRRVCARPGGRGVVVDSRPALDDDVEVIRTEWLVRWCWTGLTSWHRAGELDVNGDAWAMRRAAALLISFGLALWVGIWRLM